MYVPCLCQLRVVVVSEADLKPCFFIEQILELLQVERPFTVSENHASETEMVITACIDL